MNRELIVSTPQGLYCPAGDFHIDPCRPVPRAVITHAHADHARRGHAAYLATRASEGVLRRRLGGIAFQGLTYGESVALGSARVSLHPAGHVLGSAQVRVEVGGEVWVVSGDYFLSGDGGWGADVNPTCAPFEPVRCHCFVTESTFALPVYRWAPQREVFADIGAWWRVNAEAGRTSVLTGYSFGKAQHLLAGVEASIGPIFVPEVVAVMNEAYRAQGVALPATRPVETASAPALRGALVVAPPGFERSGWSAVLQQPAVAFASGWMQLRHARRRAGLARGFALSDHADWPGLLAAVAASGASRIVVTHGSASVLVRWLRQRGWDAGTFGEGGRAGPT